MKEVRLEWLPGTSILQIFPYYKHTHIAELRKNKLKYWEHGDLPTWTLHPVSINDDVIYEYFGEKFYNKTCHGFDTVDEFRNWLKEKECL